MKDLPPWLPLALTFLGGLLIPFAVSWARRTAARFRGDKDPNNDKLADLLDALADALGKGDLEAAKAIHTKMTTVKK